MISWTEQEGIDAKQAWHRAYAGFKRHAESKGFKKGWVAYTFREFSGRWPNGEAVEDAAPANATLRWLLRQRAKEWAKQRRITDGIDNGVCVGMGDSVDGDIYGSALMTIEDWEVKL